jgi:hypothetical protein
MNIPVLNFRYIELAFGFTGTSDSDVDFLSITIIFIDLLVTTTVSLTPFLYYSGLHQRIKYSCLATSDHVG